MMHVEVRNTCPTRPNVNNWFYVCVGESTFNLIRVFKWIGSSLRANSLQIGISFKPSKTSGHQKQLQQPSWGQRRASRQTNLSWSGCWTGPLRPSSQGCWGWTVSPGRCPPWPGLWLFWRTNEMAGVVAECGYTQTVDSNMWQSTRELTCLQICALRSQTELSASCL